MSNIEKAYDFINFRTTIVNQKHLLLAQVEERLTCYLNGGVFRAEPGFIAFIGDIINSGYADRVKIINADGSLGYSEKAPFDRIVVTAAAPAVPQPLIDQLKTGGIMLIPIGNVSLFQNLLKISKGLDGKIKKEKLG